MKIPSQLSTVLAFIPKKVALKAVKKTLKAHFKDSKHAIKDLFAHALPRQSAPAPVLAQVHEIATVAVIIPTQESAPVIPASPEAVPLKGDLLERISHLWQAAIALDFLCSLYSPLNIPQESPVYPLFSYGTKILKLEGVFKMFEATRPSDIRTKMLQPLFVLGRTARITARSLYACQAMCGYVQAKMHSNTPAPPLRVELQNAHAELATTVTSVVEAQDAQHTLVTQAQEAAIEQTGIVSRLSQLSSEQRQLLGSGLEQLQTALGATAQQLQQEQIEQAHRLITQLREQLTALPSDSP